MQHTKSSAATRARRLLTLLHLLESDSTYELDTIAELLGTNVAEVTEDLEGLACCGVAPYYPDQLMPLFVENGALEVFGELPALGAPVRLSAREAHALAAALQAAGIPAEDGLTQRLLSAAAPPDVSGKDMEQIIRSAASPGTATTLATIAAGLHESRVVHIAYRSTGAETERDRDIEVLAITAERGVWYAEAFCRHSGGLRTFRIDRMRTADLTSEQFTPRPLSVPGVALATDELPMARLAFSADEDFSERDWPGGRIVSRSDNLRLEVDVPFAGTAWIARKVLARMGAVEALSPPEVRSAVADLARTEIK